MKNVSPWVYCGQLSFHPLPEHSKNVIESYHPWDLWTTKPHISFFGMESLIAFTYY